jgi:hypothetical protein
MRMNERRERVKIASVEVFSDPGTLAVEALTL